MGSWRRQRLLPQGRVPVRAGRVLVASAGSLSSMPAEISALVLSGQQLTNSPGRWLVLSTFYGPTPNHTVLRPVAWSPPILPHSRLQDPTPNRVVLHQRMWWCNPLHQTTSSCSPLCSPESHCRVVQPTALSCTLLHGSAPHCLVLHPAARSCTKPRHPAFPVWSCTPLQGQAPHCMILHPTTWSCAPPCCLATHRMIPRPVTRSRTLLRGPAPHHMALHPPAWSCIPPCGPSPHGVVLHPIARSLTLPRSHSPPPGPAPHHPSPNIPPAQPEHPPVIHPPLAGKLWWLEQLHVLFILQHPHIIPSLVLLPQWLSGQLWYQPEVSALELWLPHGQSSFLSR